MELNRKHSKGILAVSAVLGVVLIVGCFFVKSELEIVKFFRASDPIQISDRMINKKMAGTKALNVVLDSDVRDPIARKGSPDEVIDVVTPEILKKIDQFSVDIKKTFPAVQKVDSFADVLKKMNQEMNGGDPAAYAIPDDPALVSQYLMIFSGDTKTFLTSNHDKLRIMITMNAGGSEDTHKVALYSQAYFAPDFQSRNHLQVQVTGNEQIIYAANQKLTRGTIESIFLCVIIVVVILLLILRSFPMTLIAIVPILFCVLMDFGLLGFFRDPPQHHHRHGFLDRHRHRGGLLDPLHHVVPEELGRRRHHPRRRTIHRQQGAGHFLQSVRDRRRLPRS